MEKKVSMTASIWSACFSSVSTLHECLHMTNTTPSVNAHDVG